MFNLSVPQKLGALTEYKWCHILQWVARLTQNLSVAGYKQTPPKAHIVSLSKKLYPHCLALVGSRNGFELDFTVKLK